MNIEQILKKFPRVCVSYNPSPWDRTERVDCTEGFLEALTTLQAEHEREMGELVDTAWEYCVKATRAENWSKRELQEAIATRRGLLKELDQPTV